jgi:hypothetical protein
LKSNQVHKAKLANKEISHIMDFCPTPLVTQGNIGHHIVHFALMRAADINDNKDQNLTTQ